MEDTASQSIGSAPAAGSAAPPADRRDRRIAAVCALLLVIGMPIAYFTDNPSTGDVIGCLALVAFSLALMAGIVLWLLPRERATTRAPRTALILGVLAVLTGLVFWTGLPFPIGAGAIALGASLREARAPADGRGKATTAVALGTFAVVASFVVLLVG